MKSEEFLKMGIRREIYQYVLSYPGLHLRELARKMNMSYSTLKYHLSYLMKRDLVISKKETKYVRYYVKDQIGTDDKKLISLFRKQIPREMIIWFLFFFCASQSDLSHQIGVHPTTIKYHLKKLLEAGIIEPAPIKDGLIPLIEHPRYIKRKPEGNEIIYRMTNPRFVYDGIIKYKKSFFDTKVIEDIIELFDFAISGEQPKYYVKPTKNFEDKFIDAFYDMFPHPYH